MNIYITRGNHYTDKKRKYKIIIDETCAGKIGDNETKKITLPQGQHIIYFKIDWCRSNKVIIRSDDENRFFEVGPSVTGWKNLLPILYITFWKNRYLYAKKLKLSS